MSAVCPSRAAGWLAAAALALASGAAAQSLAELAAKQKEQQEKRKGKPAKVYTEDDLKQGSTRGFTPADQQAAPDGEPAPAAAPAPAASAPAQKSEDELRTEQEKAWREKLQKSRDNVTQLDSEVNRLQTALNDLTQPAFGATRANRLAALDKAKQQLGAAQQSVADLEEEGRRRGFR